jgi:hypothetical protein
MGNRQGSDCAGLVPVLDAGVVAEATSKISRRNGLDSPLI